jgi:hypothetical protein
VGERLRFAESEQACSDAPSVRPEVVLSGRVAGAHPRPRIHVASRSDLSNGDLSISRSIIVEMQPAAHRPHPYELEPPISSD